MLNMNDFALVLEEVAEVDFAVYRELIRFGVCVLHWIKRILRWIRRDGIEAGRIESSPATSCTYVSSN